MTLRIKVAGIHEHKRTETRPDFVSKYQKTNRNEIFPQVNNGNKVINASLDIKESNQ